MNVTVQLTSLADGPNLSREDGEVSETTLGQRPEWRKGRKERRCP